MKKHNTIGFALMVLVMAGCAHYPANAPLKAYDPDKGYRFENIQNAENSDSLFVILSFSGGGTRAAALSYGVLEQLKATMITREGKARRLLDEVDVISGVSGGSFTAAYYALYGERIFAEYENVFLKQNIQGRVQRQLYSPVNWVRLASPLYDRIDMAAEYYDENIFHHATFKDLLKKGRPYILINATDMTLGARFEFTQDQFDFLCSDLGDFPISRAVAASSAFPVLLSPITLKNHAGACAFREPQWLSNALKDRDIGGRRFANATQMQSYLDPSRRPYIHLLDGGIADNIGLRGPYRSLASTDSAGSILRMINRDKIKKVVVVVVNAKTDPDITFDGQEDAPGLTDVLMTVATAPMDNYSFETIELLRESIKQWEKDAQARKDCEEALRKNCPNAKLESGPLAEVGFYTVVVGFDSLQDAGERAFLKNLPTTFNLTSEAVDRIRAAGAKLLGESPEFQRLVKDLQ